MKKFTEFCKLVFGYGIMITLFAGGLTFFAYLIALIIGGDIAALICEITYKHVIPVIVKISTSMILLGLMCMYLSGEKSLTPSEKKKKITNKK
jgi:hypothetical protein